MRNSIWLLMPSVHPLPLPVVLEYGELWTDPFSSMPRGALNFPDIYARLFILLRLWTLPGRPGHPGCFAGPDDTLVAEGAYARARVQGEREGEKK